MPNLRTSDETPATLPLTGAELVRIVQGSGNAKATTQNIANTATVTQIGTGAVQRTVTAEIQDIVKAEQFGAVGDGSFLNDTAIANAIAAGKVVKFKQGLTYLHANPIIHGSTLLDLNGAILKYTGNAQQITYPTTGSTSYGGIINGTLDSTTSTCTQALQVRSGFVCKYRDVVLKVNSTTATAIDLICNSTGTGDPEGTLNTVGCIFENVTIVGNIGRVYRFSGNISGSVVQQAVTLNNFINCSHYGNCAIVGLDEVQACDNNHFIGVCRIECDTDNAIGRITNSSNPSGNAGVYANNADNLAIDTFGTHTGRIGWQLNYSKDTVCTSFFQNPAAEGGALVVNGAISFETTVKEVGGTNYSSKHLYGTNIGVGALAVPNVGCLVSFPGVTGASQYGIQSFVGPDNTVSTAAAFIGQVTSRALAYTVPTSIGFFAPPAVKGAGSTITTDFAFYAQDRSAGNSNYGYYSTIAVGFGKWQFYGAGTAASQFNGLVSVTGFAQLGKTVVNNNSATTYTVAMGYSIASTSYVAFTGTNAASIAFTFTNATLVPDGWRVDIYTQAAVGTTTWASTGATFVGAPTSLAAGSVTRFIYHAATTQWLPA